MVEYFKDNPRCPYWSSTYIIPYSQKQKKPAEFVKIGSAGFGLLSGTFFFLPSKELLGGHAPMNGNIVAALIGGFLYFSYVFRHRVYWYLCKMKKRPLQSSFL